MRKYFDKFKRIPEMLGVFTGTVFLLCFALHASAATISLVPSTTTVSAGNIVSVTVSTNTEGTDINNAEATLQFPADLLEVVSINKVPSIFTLWVEEPSFSNSTGTITFNGGVSNPGYTGTSGTIATVTFRAKKAGTATILFADAAVRQNDGLGTDVLTSKNQTTIQIGTTKDTPVPPPVSTPTVVSAVPKPVIVSTTNPNQSEWYSGTTASFDWKIPNGVTSLETLFNKSPDSTPSIKYDNSVTEKTLTNLSDGVAYFHLRFAHGATYGPVAHYKVNIDGTSPSAFSPTVRESNGKLYIALHATDALSGIDHYTIGIDATQTIEVKQSDLVDGEYMLPGLTEGSHDLFVSAYDKAGNHTDVTVNVTAPALTSPILSLSSNEVTQEDAVVIFGKTNYPNSHVSVMLESQGNETKTYLTTTSSDGTFSFSTDSLKHSGLIKITGVNVLGEHVISKPSDELYLKVNERTEIKITRAALGIVIVSILLILLLLALYTGWHKFFGLKKKIDEDLKKTIDGVHKATLLLKEELEDQLSKLEKVKEDRALNKKEKAIFAEIKANVESLDAFIEEKLKKLM